MTLLILGIFLWWAGHLFKRVAPDARTNLGDRGKGIVAGVLIFSVILMIFGYRGWDAGLVYEPPASGVHINNLLMFLAILLLGMGSSKGYSRALLRHPMLTGVLVWAFAHLLANGDAASVLLFGSMAIWAIAEMVVINRTEGPWQRPEPGPLSGDLKLIAIAVVLYVVIAILHNWLGRWPFPS